MSDTNIKQIKQIQVPPIGEQAVGEIYDIAAIYDGKGEEIEKKYLQLAGGTMTGNLAITNAAMELSGRYYGIGDDEGLIIKPASNGFAGVCLGTHDGVRSVFYLNSSNQALWRYNPNETTSYDIFHPKKAGTIALTNDLNLSTTSAGSGFIVTGIDVSALGITVTKSTLEELGLNTVYKYKGTRTWAELKQITSAQIGDVYSISTQDPDGNTNADWACYNTVTTATGENYLSYWQSLGGKVDLSGYLPKSGGTMTGAGGIQFPTDNSNSKSTHFISAGSGYSTGSGKYGVKLLACDQSDCQSGLGQDLSNRGLGYDLSVVTGLSTTGIGTISFVGHKVNDTNYTTFGYFDEGSNLTVNGSIKVGGHGVFRYNDTDKCIDVILN